MEGTPAIYLGKIVSKKNFRAYIYAPNGDRRLVESWEEFEANMQSGVWFASIEDVQQSKIDQEKTKEKLPSKSKKKLKGKVELLEPVQEIDEGEISKDELDDMVFEVKDGE